MPGQGSERRWLLQLAVPGPARLLVHSLVDGRAPWVPLHGHRRTVGDLSVLPAWVVTTLLAVAPPQA